MVSMTEEEDWRAGSPSYHSVKVCLRVRARMVWIWKRCERYWICEEENECRCCSASQPHCLFSLFPQWFNFWRDNRGGLPNQQLAALKCRLRISFTQLQSRWPILWDTCHLLVIMENESILFQTNSKRVFAPHQDGIISGIYSTWQESQRTCRTQRMPFRDETTTGVDHKLAAVRVVPSVDELSSFTCRGCETNIVSSWW